VNPVVVIGAGPYGLSAAAHLRARGLPVRVLGETLGTWRAHMPGGMILKSTPAASTISAPQPGSTLQDFCGATGREALTSEMQVVPLDTFVEYGRWFQERLVPDVEPSHVLSLERRNGGFRMRLDTGEELDSPAVVVATGLPGFAYLPPVLRTVLPDGRPTADGPISHSSQHVRLDGFAGREVLVLGAGQSALEGAALLHEAGADVRLVTRRPAVRFVEPPEDRRHWRPQSPLGRAWHLYAFSYYGSAYRHLPDGARRYFLRKVLGPAGAWWLKDRVVQRVPVLAGARLTGARIEEARPVLQLTTGDGTTTETSADHVLAATGYRVDVDRLDFLSPTLRDELVRTGDAPRLAPGFRSSVPGLWFTGQAAAPTFGPVLRFVCGTSFASPRLAASVAEALR
jgi:cation diffusion facilitator CzcD-associated flavoprotein CzcO